MPTADLAYGVHSDIVFALHTGRSEVAQSAGLGRFVKLPSWLTKVLFSLFSLLRSFWFSSAEISETLRQIGPARLK